ncbi:hypothetical protein MMC21_000406 [Puttea exsequens]|nr:hypothetical protein [Puttea exsequens]
MDLARAFTHRHRRQESDLNNLHPHRAASMRRAGTIKRSAISSPLELLSTTNVLAYNAPDIGAATTTNINYGSDSDSSGSHAYSNSTRATTPDSSSINSAPSPVEPNHLSTYFQSAKSAKHGSKDSSDCDSPTIPQRAPSHSKKAHQASARLRRSASKTTLPPTQIHSPLPTNTCNDMFSNKPEPNHPFGAELTQVNELAEEIGARDVIILDEEEQFLIENGLCKFGADDYMDEIHGLFGGTYNNPFSPYTAVWI